LTTRRNPSALAAATSAGAVDSMTPSGRLQDRVVAALIRRADSPGTIMTKIWNRPAVAPASPAGSA
jgi:hypothetical protein